MIEAVIDFDELQKDRRYIDEWHLLSQRDRA